MEVHRLKQGVGEHDFADSHELQNKQKDVAIWSGLAIQASSDSDLTQDIIISLNHWK